MDEVSAFTASAVLDMAAANGLSEADLVAGLSFDRVTLRARLRIDWDDYCTLIERFETAIGGPDACDAILLASYHDAIDRNFTARLSHLSPRLFYALLELVPQCTNITQSTTELSDGRLSFAYHLRDGARPCQTFFRGSINALRGAVGRLGMPPLDGQVLELTPSSLRVALTLPASRAIDAGESPAAPSDTLRDTLVQIFGLRPDALGLDAADLRAHPVAAADAVVRRLLTLGFTSVVLHVHATSAGSATTVHHGGPTTSTAPEHIVAMSLLEREVGLIEAWGGGDRAALGALLPGLAVYLYVVHAVAAMARLERMRPPELTMRQHETLLCLMRGLSEKETADRLHISVHTAHQYVKAIYRRYGVRSRSELLARFLAS